MKESGKLIELLNEYEDGMVSWVKEYSEEFGVFILNTEQMVEEEIIISKSFGFIGWLVQNDKINTESGPLYGFQPIMNNRQPFTLYESLLMLLSISDTPIEDLISYLKIS